MAFVVEDGTGKSTSNSYLSIADFKTYWTDRGTTFTESDAVIQGWLINGTNYCDSFNYDGEILVSTQALKFPREYFYDINGTLRSGVPTELKNAVAEMAKISKTVDIFAIVDNSISSESYGNVSISYNNKTKQVSYPSAMAYLNKLIKRVGICRI